MRAFSAKDKKMDMENNIIRKQESKLVVIL